MTDYTEWRSAGTSEPRDQRRDLPDGLWAEVGPDTPGRYGYPQPWSWNILSPVDGSLEAGIEADRGKARQAVQDWVDADELSAIIDPPGPDPDAPPLPAPGSSDRRVAILKDLNAYQGANVWEDLILGLPEYDEAATVALDPSASSDRFALTDGTAIRYNAQVARWEVWL
jgi:hypothetical protein